jgi:hypothetical protein
MITLVIVAEPGLKLRLHVISHVRVDGQWLAQVVVACISYGRGQGKWIQQQQQRLYARAMASQRPHKKELTF